jgi:PKHD-type hydroxylase
MSLSDPKAYKGGALEFYIPNPEKKSIQEQSVICHEIEKKGSVVVFPSFMWHRVLPVTKGTRYSLVMWTLGQNYK